jgi:tRNA(His) 5'-end guanylyltransferase
MATLFKYKGDKNMSKHSDLDVRMKTYYEQIPKTKLMRRCPVAIRIDGKAFHTFTRGFQKPFDEILIKSMQETMKYLCENIQGCIIGYTQSDEITLVLTDYKKLNSSAWFDYEVQKMCSIAASMATMSFNKFFYKNFCSFKTTNCYHPVKDFDERKTRGQYLVTLYEACDKGAMFDARAFNIPKEEVANLIYWRQQDAIRNSIQMLGQAHFSSKQLHGKSTSAIKEMLRNEKGVDWDNLPVYKQRGSCCVKETYFVQHNDGKQLYFPDGDPVDGEMLKGTYRSRWIVDNEIPIFKGADRAYIENLVYFEEKTWNPVAIE